MSNFLKEFKEFAMKGNVVDMAVGVIIGAAFGKIVSSLVNDIIMPLIGVVTGGINFTDYKWVIQKAVMDGQEVLKPEVSMNWGGMGPDCCRFPYRGILHLRNDKVYQQPA